MFRRLAYLSRGQNGHDQYWIEASPTGHDRFARHRTTLGDVWEGLAPPGQQQLMAAPPESTRDQGTVYEQLVAADLIRQSRGRFALYRPGMDIAGRINVLDDFSRGGSNGLFVRLLVAQRLLYTGRAYGSRGNPKQRDTSI